MTQRKKLYIVSPEIKWRVFKELHDKLVHDSGPVPQQGTRTLWQMIRDKKIYAWFANDIPNDMGLGLKVPPKYKKYKVLILTNP